MRLLRVSEAYPSYLEAFYASRPELASLPYQEQKRLLDADGFSGGDVWTRATKPLGYETAEILVNAGHLQRTWAIENGAPHGDAVQIAVEQTKRFKPDVLWFDSMNEDLLDALRGISSIRLVLGWLGSYVPVVDTWKKVDVMLSCAPETVERISKAGMKAEQIHHGFDPMVLDRLKASLPRRPFTFVGQIIRGKSFHFERERILDALARTTPLEIYSPSSDLSIFKTVLKHGAKAALYQSVQFLKTIGIAESKLKAAPILRKPFSWGGPPVFPFNLRLKSRLRPGVYGMKMYELLAQSDVTLNIHADSSPRFASNMRLFEATGVGSCLLTDSRPNLPELFQDGQELVTYKSPEECVEKLNWLLEHPAERSAIAASGQKRTLSSHTYARRAERLDEIIKKHLH